MKQVFLKQMTMINFKGHKELTVSFTDKTIISGDNATGKSTVFDAFVWLMFGVDQFDRKDYEITPIQNGKPLEKVDSEVSAVIDFEGSKINLKRVLHQKWVRKRGAAEETYDGNETLYFINEVGIKAGEYKSKIDSIVEERVFKMITKPNAFFDLHWQKQREFLFQIAGTINDKEIALKSPKFANLLDLIQNKSLVEFKKELSARKKKINEELETIQPRIDQTTRLKPENRDFVAVEVKVKELETELADINKMLADKSELIRGQYAEIQNKQKEISTLELQYQTLKNAADQKAKQAAFDSNHARNELLNQTRTFNSELIAAKNELEISEGAIKVLVSKKDSISAEMETLRKKWFDENAKEYQSGECLICPMFKHECDSQKAIAEYNTDKYKAKTVWLQNKQAALEKINESGASLKEELAKIVARIENGKKHIESLNIRVQAAQESYNSAIEKLANTKEVEPVTPNYAEMPELVEIIKKIDALKAETQQVKPVDNSDLESKRTELTRQRDELKKQLSEKELIESYNAEIQTLNGRGKELAQQLSDLEQTEFTMSEFSKVRIEECEKRINSLFQLVRFKLFDYTNEGNEFETCIATNLSGVPISATNTAEKINAGLDVIDTLSKFYNVSAPIFIDQSESVNQFIETNSQRAFLEVTEDKVLTINNL